MTILPSGIDNEYQPTSAGTRFIWRGCLFMLASLVALAILAAAGFVLASAIGLIGSDAPELPSFGRPAGARELFHTNLCIVTLEDSCNAYVFGSESTWDDTRADLLAAYVARGWSETRFPVSPELLSVRSSGKCILYSARSPEGYFPAIPWNDFDRHDVEGYAIIIDVDLANCDDAP